MQLSPDQINALKQQGQAVEGLGIVSVDPDEAVFEDIEQARDKPGVVMLECSYRDIPEQRKKEIRASNESKNRYLQEPVGAVVIDDVRGTYAPLKEPFKYPA